MSPTHRRQRRHNVPAARDLRQRETSAEDLLWEALRDRRLDGLKFRRQHPVGPFVIDFCCPARRLAIELDGGVHASQRDEDAEREGVLIAAGYRMLRFPNEAVRERLTEVLSAIVEAAQEDRLPRPFVPGRRAGL
jgi:very-short-patch-repair endonuclease